MLVGVQSTILVNVTSKVEIIQQLHYEENNHFLRPTYINDTFSFVNFKNVTDLPSPSYQRLVSNFKYKQIYKNNQVRKWGKNRKMLRTRFILNFQYFHAIIFRGN